jgi:hypothetical protein
MARAALSSLTFRARKEEDQQTWKSAATREVFKAER